MTSSSYRLEDESHGFTTFDPPLGTMTRKNICVSLIKNGMGEVDRRSLRWRGGGNDQALQDTGYMRPTRNPESKARGGGERQPQWGMEGERACDGALEEPQGSDPPTPQRGGGQPPGRGRWKYRAHPRGDARQCQAHSLQPLRPPAKAGKRGSDIPPSSC